MKMKLKELLTEDRAVSPVVGVALLIAITVILAAVIGGVVLGLGTGGVDTPQAQMQAAWSTGDTANSDVTINHNGGEPLDAEQIVFVLNGDSITEDNAEVKMSEVNSADDELIAGNSLEIDPADGEGDLEDTDAFDDGTTLTILWEDPNSDSRTVLAEFEA